MTTDVSGKPQPWWKFGFVWMVVAGPLTVVVAGFFTLYLAISSPNEIVSDHAPRVNARSTVSEQERDQGSGLVPAMQGRNHAATGAVPVTPQ